MFFLTETHKTFIVSAGHNRINLPTYSHTFIYAKIFLLFVRVYHDAFLGVFAKIYR